VKWIRTSERLPVFGDADEMGLVVVRSVVSGDVLLDVAQYDELESGDGLEWLEGARE